MPGKHKVSHISSEAIFAIPSMGSGKALLAIILCCLLISLDLNLNLSKSIRGYAKDILQPFTYLGLLPGVVIDNYNYFFTSRETFSKEIVRLKKENEKLTLINSLLDEKIKENMSQIANFTKSTGLLPRNQNRAKDSFFLLFFIPSRIKCLV